MNEPPKNQSRLSLLSTAARYLGLCILAAACFFPDQGTTSAEAELRQASGMSSSETIKAIAALWNALWPNGSKKHSKR